jgi:AraC family transcriptional regulator
MTHIVSARTLFESNALRIAHALARPTSSALSELESAGVNVLVLPLAGVFAMHDGPRRAFVATANHALLLSPNQPYRLSFPGLIGDEYLTLRWSPTTLAQLVPQAMSRDGLNLKAFAPQLLLPPRLMVARSLLWHHLRSGQADPLQVEERAVDLLVQTLHAAHCGRAPTQSTPRCAQAIERVKQAIAADPCHRWTLAQLAAHGCVSPHHLAHVFRHTGTTLYGYVLRERLARALEAVLHSDDELTGIALASGFSSHSHFTAHFHALFGIAPSALRRTRRTSTASSLRKIVTAPPVALV